MSRHCLAFSPLGKIFTLGLRPIDAHRRLTYKFSLYSYKGTPAICLVTARLTVMYGRY